MNIVQSIEMLNFVIAQADSAPAAPTGPFGGGLMGMAPMLIGLVAIMYFFTIRPQQTREKERKKMLEALSKGDEVITTGGIIGTVANLKKDEVVLKVDDKVSIKFVRGSIAQVISSKQENES